MQQKFEAILSWLKSSLGSSSPIVTLYSATCDFVFNLYQQPFVPRLSAIRQVENFFKSRSCGSVLVYAPKFRIGIQSLRLVGKVLS